jgi:hypothetical protein
MRPSLSAFRWAAASLGTAALLVSSAAGAQPGQNAPPGADRSNSQFTLRREGPGGPDADLARARAQAGDCAGALPLFDNAINRTIEPTLRRDRGLCHEKLGHPFPAIDDYRSYLHARPEAADSDAIRQRLAALEGQSTESRGATGEDNNPELAGGNARASGSVSLGTGGASASGSASTESHAIIGPRPGEKAQDFDYYVEQEKLNDVAAHSALRNGTGLVLGPFIQMPRFFFGKGARSGALAWAFGATVRYSTGPHLTLMGELGYGGIGTEGEATSQAGVTVFGGLELRIPISRWASDHLLLRGGAGYERKVVSGTRFINDLGLARFAFGYRHVFGPSIGLEALADGGPVLIVPESGDTRINGVVGLSVALVVGF